MWFLQEERKVRKKRLSEKRNSGCFPGTFTVCCTPLVLRLNSTNNIHINSHPEPSHAFRAQENNNNGNMCL